MRVLRIEGPVREHNSAGTTLRCLAQALLALDYRVRVTDTGWHQLDAEFDERPPIDGEVTFTFATEHAPPYAMVQQPSNWQACPDAVRRWNRDCLFLAAPSQHAREWLMYHGCERVEVLGRGCDPAFRPIPIGDREATLRELGIEPLNHDLELTESIRLFGHYGFLGPFKGTAETLEAYRRLADPTRHLVIHGAKSAWGRPVHDFMDDGSYPPIWYGTRPLNADELARMVNCFDAAVFPNWHEGFGQCGLQTLACRVPTVLPRHTGNLEYADGLANWLTRFEPTWWKACGDEQFLLCMKPDVDELVDVMANIREHRVAVPDEADWSYHATRLVESFAKHGVRLAKQANLTPPAPKVPAQGTLLLGIIWGQDEPERLANCLRSLAGQPVRVVILRDTTTEHGSPLPDMMQFGYDLEVHNVWYERGEAVSLNAIRNRIFEHVGDEPFIGTLDGDCFVEGDWVQRIIDALTAQPNGLMVFPRVRLLDGDVVPDPPGAACKSLETITVWCERYDLDALLNIGAGPAQAVAVAHAQRFDESIIGWGGNEQEWVARHLIDGLVPVLGGTVYHQEHPVQAGKEATLARNAGQVWNLAKTRYDGGNPCR